MVKLVKEFLGVPNGEIYPVAYKPGDECPDELLNAAAELGAVDKKSAAKIASDAAAEAARVAQEEADRKAAEEEAAKKAAEGGNA